MEDSQDFAESVNDDFQADPRCAPTHLYVNARVAQLRGRVFVHIAQFQNAMARPENQYDALILLSAILQSSKNYFAELNDSLQNECQRYAVPRRRAQRRILGEIREIIDRLSTPAVTVSPGELAHALDGFLMYDTALGAREPRWQTNQSDKLAQFAAN